MSENNLLLQNAQLRGYNYNTGYNQNDDPNTFMPVEGQHQNTEEQGIKKYCSPLNLIMFGGTILIILILLILIIVYK